MRNTPCLPCFNLRGEKGNYTCNVNGEQLDDDLVAGIDIDRLPDCPYFIQPDKGIQKSWQRSDYIPMEPIFSSSTEQTMTEIIGIIERFYQKRNRWPTQRQIFVHSRLQSNGDLWNILDAMQQDGRLEKIRGPYLGRFVYKLPSFVAEAIPA